MPKSTNKFLTMKQAPPRIKFEDNSKTYTQYDEDLRMRVVWYHNGIIQIAYDTGVVETYYPKPSISDIVKSTGNGEYYRVHKDGSVEYGFRGEYYYWGPDDDVEWNMSNIQQLESPVLCEYHPEEEDDLVP